MAEYYVKNFNVGLTTLVEDESVKAGSASDSSNWLSLGDHIELRRGQQLMGSNVSGTGVISGLFVGQRFDGEDVAFESFERKVKYFDDTTEDWIETTTVDVIPAIASGEDFAFDKYHSLAGAFAYGSSKNSGIYKIPLANPGSIVDQLSTSHRGKIRIKQNRMFLWDRKDTNGGFDTTGLYGSYIDHDELSDYTAVVAEALGALGSTTYSGTLAFKSGFPKRTCMYVSIQATVAAGTETFRDTRNGTLLSNFGSTGTINYATGAYSVTFSGVTTGNVTSDYYWEDATNHGIADFTKDTPRDAGQGFVFRQDDGGADLQNVVSFGATEYCFHVLKTWALTLGSDDTEATNLIYRAHVGIPNWRAVCETGEGVYYIDAFDKSNPTVRRLEYGVRNEQVIPIPISENLDLSGYLFDKSALFEWGTYIVMACRTQTSTVNDTVFMYNRTWKLWDKMSDYRVAMFEKYNGALIAGDSASKNTFTLFSGLTDEESEIPNYWVSNKDGLGTEGTKYANLFEINGLIGIDQELEVFLSFDGGAFVSVETITGDGPYVDQTQAVTIGSFTEGSTLIGGGGQNGGAIQASPYRREFRINTPRFGKVRVKFVANKVGYVSVSQYGFKDLRAKGKTLPSQYVVN